MDWGGVTAASIMAKEAVKALVVATCCCWQWQLAMTHCWRIVGNHGGFCLCSDFTYMI